MARLGCQFVGILSYDGNKCLRVSLREYLDSVN